jgi:hypothetical protein
MEVGKNSVIYMGLISGPNKADDTCGRTTVTGTMDRGFTVLIAFPWQQWLRECASMLQCCLSFNICPLVYSLAFQIILNVMTHKFTSGQ